MLDVGAVGGDVFAEFLSDFAVAFEEVFAGHACLAGCSARGYDILGILECGGGVGCPRKVDIGECAVVHLGHDAPEAVLVDVVKAYVAGEPQHHRGLCHVGADHSGGAHDEEFFVCEEFHIGWFFVSVPKKALQR